MKWDDCEMYQSWTVNEKDVCRATAEAAGQSVSTTSSFLLPVTERVQRQGETVTRAENEPGDVCD